MNNMLRLIAVTTISLLYSFANAQTNLITNGTFEATSVWTGWSTSVANGDLWGGTGACTAHGGVKNIWLGDDVQQYGVNYATEDLYQTVSIPSTATSCVLDFYSSINTLETGTTPYDYLYVRLRSTSGALLATLGYLSNVQGSYGIPGCQTWNHIINVNIPSTYFGTTVRVSFEFTTDGSDPTIFRLDDISLMATTGVPCTYSLSPYSYTCPTSAATVYNNISSVITQTGCDWYTTVTSGSSWLATSSYGSGNGNISIYVDQNTSPNSRNGTIDINGQILTITQPGTCTYSLSQNNYTCANASANTLNNIVTVTTQNGCNWAATVTSGNSWLSTTSSGVGSGALSISVLQNTTGSSRNGTININGQTLNINQPGGCSYSLSQSTYTCANTSAGTLNSILLVNTQTGCSWTATVTSGGSWLTTSSSGTGSGALSITVLENTTTSPRNGTIDVNGQTVTITQPGIACTYSLSSSTYVCPEKSAKTYDNIALVSTLSGCNWTATVTNGSSWLATSSSGTGSGAISIIVLENTSGLPRNGTVNVNGQTLTITQPAFNVGIGELETNHYSIYPNPGHDKITIAANQKMLGRDFQIFDNLGRIVIDGRISNLTTVVQIESLSPGIYFFKLNSEQVKSKLIKY